MNALGYTTAQLKAAFDLVKNLDDWRGPIDRVVPLTTDLGMVEAAVAYFTGCRPEFTFVASGVRVRAAGYIIANLFGERGKA